LFEVAHKTHRKNDGKIIRKMREAHTLYIEFFKGILTLFGAQI
jgi:hypothetical protein